MKVRRTTTLKICSEFFNLNFLGWPNISFDIYIISYLRCLVGFGLLPVSRSYSVGSILAKTRYRNEVQILASLFLRVRYVLIVTIISNQSYIECMEICDFCKTSFDLEIRGFRVEEIPYCSSSCLHKGDARHRDFFKKINI